MNISNVIEILETLVINVKTNCDNINTEKMLIKEAANKIINSNYIELPFNEERNKYYEQLLK